MRKEWKQATETETLAIYTRFAQAEMLLRIWRDVTTINTGRDGRVKEAQDNER